MWSLAIEEQFYLVWPLLVVLLGHLVPKRKGRAGQRGVQLHGGSAVRGSASPWGVSFVRMDHAVLPAGGDPNRVYYGTDTRAFIILIGAALGALTGGALTVTSRVARTWLIRAGCFGAVALLAAFAWSTTNSSYLYEGAYGAIAVLMVVVLAAAAQPGDHVLARILKTRPIVGLGLISYGVYLWHWPIKIWVTQHSVGVGGGMLFLLRAAITLAAALASFFLIEQPIRRGHIPGSFLKNRGVVPMALVTAVALVLLIPAVAFPSLRSVPTPAGTSATAAAVSARYANAPRCDKDAGASPNASGRPFRVQLVGNSIAQESRPCLEKILRARGAELGGTSPFGFSLCILIPDVKKEVDNPRTRPDVAVWFALANYYDTGCGPNRKWQETVRTLVAMWKAAGVHVFLVPAISGVAGAGYTNDPHADERLYKSMARKDPKNITVLDAGAFIRDDKGVYQWRMPCVDGEAGCSKNHTVGVRWTDGFHYCADPAFGSRHDVCPSPKDQAGERRVASGLAEALMTSLGTMGDALQATPG